MGTLFTPWAIRVAVTLRIPDMIAQGVTEPGPLAECTRTDAHALLRLLRHLANLGLLRSQGASGFGLTELGRVLCHDHPAGVAGFYDQGDAWVRAGDHVIPGLLHSVRTGRPAWEHVHGKPFWEALAAGQELAEAFDRAMSVHVSDIGPWLAANRDWATVRHVVDVGGGTGRLLATLLHGHAHLRGTVVEQAATAARASALFAEEGLSQRATALSGSFFDALPLGGDVYLLAHILHDWPDEEAVAVLRRCADALNGRGRIFVVDRIRAESSDTESAETATQLAVSQRDMAMLVVLGGVERSEEEFQQVGMRAGLRLVSAVPTAEKGLFLMEFVPER
ncbi:methyltransferase [Streptomyces netropsis]